MATITSSTFLDGGVARTAGEAWTINSGAVLTIRTDTRWHANAPAAMNGTLGSLTINEGEWFIDATSTRWLAYSSGTGNAPAIGTTISQGGVSGYLLGVWASLTSAPTAVGVAIPATGFLKLREVSGGAFAAGVLSGISASASSADVSGWIEVVFDQAANMTIPRLGRATSRGAPFYLDETTGVRGQVIQTPTNGGGANTFVPAVFIEKYAGAIQDLGIKDGCDRYPALNGATNGWAYQHIGQAQGTTDKRQKFVKMLTGGQVQIGEAQTVTATYASVAAQASTYVSSARSGTYTWSAGIITVYCASGHFLVTGQQTGLDFTSGSATANDGIYTATVLDPYYFTVPLAGSGTGGNVTSRESVTVTFTAHRVNINDAVYCDFTTGTAVDGTFTVYAVPSANTYLIPYPHVAALTSGNVSCYHTVTFTTSAAHNLAIGNLVRASILSGAGTTGDYWIKTVPTTTTFTVNMVHTAAIASSNAELLFDIGYVPAAGLKVWIPNILCREASTGSRATNNAPNGTAATRPEFNTTAAGYIDYEFLSCANWYMNFAQAYYVRVANCTAMDYTYVSEVATQVEYTNVAVGQYAAADANVFSITSCFAGGTVDNCTFHRGNVPGTSDHSVQIQYSSGFSVTNSEFGIIQYARSTGYPLVINACSEIDLESCAVKNGTLNITTLLNSTISNTDYCDRFTGGTNATSGTYAITLGTKCSVVTVSGMTVGLGSTVSNCQPYSGLVTVSLCDAVSVRSIGSSVAPVKTVPTFAPNLFATNVLLNGGGNSNRVKVQRIWAEGVRTAVVTTVNSDKNFVYESLFTTGHYQLSSYAVPVLAFASLNMDVKLVAGVNTTTGQASVYGSHFQTMVQGDTRGRLILTMNEPTADTIGQYTATSGAPKFNSSGGVLMAATGTQAVWETPFWVLGYTGFVNALPTMSGGTIGNYLLEYQIDVGTGYSAWKTVTGANLSGETIGASGFKLKLRITTTVANTTAITFLRFDLTTTQSAQWTAAYPLDTVQFSVTGLQPDSEVRAYVGADPDTSVEIAGIESSGTSFTFYHEHAGQDGYIVVFSLGYEPQFIPVTYSAVASTIPVQQQVDRVFNNP